MLPRTNLILLRDQFEQLSQTHYFNKPTQIHVSKLVSVVNFLINRKECDQELIRGLVDRLWITYQYLSGSTSREFPYEVVYALRKALKDWLAGEAVITTALLDDCSFHFLNINPWEYIRVALPDVEAIHFDANFIHVGMPRLYKSKPIYCSPLYHELGHFVDTQFGISSTVMLLNGIENNNLLARRHLREYFADLFSATYCGSMSVTALQCLAGDNPASDTHPATNDRISIIADYLQDKDNTMVEAFQRSLRFLQLPELKSRFVQPDIGGNFDNLEPFIIRNDEEMHGMFSAGWHFLNESSISSESLCNFLKEDEYERTVNDLVEKSIRNYAIREQWGP